MKNALAHFSFLIPAFLFLIHQILQKGFGVQFWFIDSYLDPFCLGALIIPIYQLERKILFKQNVISTLEKVLLILFTIIISEILIPSFFENFTQDIWDALAIIIGSIWFMLFRNK